MIIEKTNCTATGIRYDPVSFRSLVAFNVIAAIRRPIVMAHWNDVSQPVQSSHES